MIVDLERGANEVSPSRGRLVKQALVLEHLAQHDVEHTAMPDVGHRINLRAPLVHELGIQARVFSRQGFPAFFAISRYRRASPRDMRRSQSSSLDAE